MIADRLTKLLDPITFKGFIKSLGLTTIVAAIIEPSSNVLQEWVKVLVYFPYTPANRNDVFILVRRYFMYLVSVDSLHSLLIYHTDAHISSLNILKKA